MFDYQKLVYCNFTLACGKGGSREIKEKSVLGVI